MESFSFGRVAMVMAGPIFWQTLDKRCFLPDLKRHHPSGIHPIGWGPTSSFMLFSAGPLAQGGGSSGLWGSFYGPFAIEGAFINGDLGALAVLNGLK